MGSIQQSILGVFCITTAFLLGQYIRNHPSPKSLEQQRQQQASVATAPSLAFGSTVPTDSAAAKVESPRLPSPSDGFGVEQSVDTQTFRDAVSNSSSTVQPVVRDINPAMPAVVEERTIDIPDFSELAASFQNTPLELPRSNLTTPDRETAAPRTHSGSFYIRPAQDLASTSPSQPASIGASGAAGRSAFTGSRPEPVAPPEPTEIYQISERPTSFRREDFQPRLISKETSRRDQGRSQVKQSSIDVEASHLRIESGNRRISLAPPQQDDSFPNPEIPDLEVTIPRGNRSESGNKQSAFVRGGRANNQVHSYYDVGTVAGSNSVLDRNDFERNNTLPRSANRRIPFGLNEQGQRELTKIRSRQQTNIDLQTNQFSAHTTQVGDTLQSLSTEYYGKPDFYLDIYLANQQLLRNPTAIPPGIQLRIPKYEQ